MISNILFGILVFVPIILILVIIHEFGHYVTAKIFKVHVHEFGFGFFLPLFKLYTGNTIIACNDNELMDELYLSYKNGEIIKLPVQENADGNLIMSPVSKLDILRKRAISRSVLVKSRIANFQSQNSKNDLIIEGKIKSIKENQIIISSMAWSFNLIPLGGFVKPAGENNRSIPRSLKKLNPIKQSIILVSGSFVNLIVPIIIVFIFFLVPHPVENNGYYVINQIEPDSYAEQIGFEINDLIVAINDINMDNMSKYSIISESKFQISTWIIQRNNTNIIIETNPVERYGIRFNFIVTDTKYGSESPWTALQTTVSKTQQLSTSLSKEIIKWTTGESAPEVMGPIGMVNITSQVTSQAGIIGWGIILIVISINLGIVNLLPIPSLDGGRLLFVIIECIRGGKQLPDRVEGMIHGISFIVLIIIILLVSANDVHELLK